MTDTKIETIFGELDSNKLEIIKEGIKEISVAFSKISMEKDNIKSILDSMHEGTDVPKKILRKIARIYHESNFDEVSTEYNELEAIYTTIIDQ